MRSVRLKSVCYSEMDLLNPCQIYHVKIQVETESDAKVAKTLVFANSKWESLANLQPGWNQCDSWCLHIVSSSGWISTPRFVDEGNPPDIFLLQVGESNTYIYIYNDSDRKGPCCRAFGTSQKRHESRYVLSSFLFVGTKDHCRCHHLEALRCADQETPCFTFWSWRWDHK